MRRALSSFPAAAVIAIGALAAVPAWAHTGDNNRGDVWVDNVGQPPGPGHEMDPHLSCLDINLWGSGLGDHSGTFTIDGWPPSGSGAGDQAWPGTAAHPGNATWAYPAHAFGSVIIAVIDVHQLLAHARSNGDTAQPIQGFHFKVQFSADPQKHKTFWVRCDPVLPTPTPSPVSSPSPHPTPSPSASPTPECDDHATSAHDGDNDDDCPPPPSPSPHATPTPQCDNHATSAHDGDDDNDCPPPPSPLPSPTVSSSPSPSPTPQSSPSPTPTVAISPVASPSPPSSPNPSPTQAVLPASSSSPAGSVLAASTTEPNTGLGGGWQLPLGILLILSGIALWLSQAPRRRGREG